MQKLDRELWEHSKHFLEKNFFDGSFPVLRQIMTWTNEELQSKYLEEEYAERKKGKDYDPFGGVLLFLRGEMDRRISEGLVSFEETENEVEARQPERGEKAETFRTVIKELQVTKDKPEKIVCLQPILDTLGVKLRDSFRHIPVDGCCERV